MPNSFFRVFEFPGILPRCGHTQKYRARKRKQLASNTCAVSSHSTGVKHRNGVALESGRPVRVGKPRRFRSKKEKKKKKKKSPPLFRPIPATGELPLFSPTFSSFLFPPANYLPINGAHHPKEEFDEENLLYYNARVYIDKKQRGVRVGGPASPA